MYRQWRSVAGSKWRTVHARIFFQIFLMLSGSENASHEKSLQCKAWNSSKLWSSIYLLFWGFMLHAYTRQENVCLFFQRIWRLLQSYTRLGDYMISKISITNLRILLIIRAANNEFLLTIPNAIYPRNVHETTTVGINWEKETWYTELGKRREQLTRRDLNKYIYKRMVSRGPIASTASESIWIWWAKKKWKDGQKQPNAKRTLAHTWKI